MEKAFFPLRPEHLILVAVRSLRRPLYAGPAGSSTIHPIPGRTPAPPSCSFPPEGGGNGLTCIPHIPVINLQKPQLLLRLFRYFKGKKGEPHFFNRRNIWLIVIADAYILPPDEFLFDGIRKLGLLDDAAVILGAIFPVFFPDGD